MCGGFEEEFKIHQTDLRTDTNMKEIYERPSSLFPLGPFHQVEE